MTGGRLDYAQLDIMCRDAGFWTRELETVLETKGEGAYLAAIERGEQDVLRNIYGGSPSALQSGLKEIVEAIHLTFGDRAPAVIEQIDAHAALANPKVHDQVLIWARATFKTAAPRQQAK